MTYPDLHLQIEEQVAEGDLVATRVTMTGTHRGEWPPGVKATNKPFELQLWTLTGCRMAGLSNMVEQPTNSWPSSSVVSSTLDP
jgi:hypothetical protein